MNLVIAPEPNIRLGTIYHRRTLYLPVYETGWTIGGDTEVELCGVVFNTEDSVDRWMEKNRKNFTGLQLLTAKIS